VREKEKGKLQNPNSKINNPLTSVLSPEGKGRKRVIESPLSQRGEG